MPRHKLHALSIRRASSTIFPAACFAFANIGAAVEPSRIAVTELMRRTLLLDR